MGIKKLFKKKEPTEQELVEDLQKVGISTKTTNGRQEKFGAFKQYAHERQSQRTGLAPVNPYAAMDNSTHNPYASQSSELESFGRKSNFEGEDETQNAYEGSQSQRPRENPHSSNPYASHPSENSPKPDTGYNRYQRSNPYEKNLGRSAPGVTAERRYKNKNPIDSRSNNYKNDLSLAKDGDTTGLRDDELTLDLNDIPTGRPPVQMKRPIRKPAGTDYSSLDLNELPDEDLNVELDEFLSDQEQVNSEDEEVEVIKQDIRFTKQESVALTRNTLRMAQEAEASGTNTLGMLGSQSERLYNAEQNLLLADTQTKIANEKVKELGRLNRSIFIPATGNPFNKKSRLRQQELKLKAEKIQEKYLRDTNRKEMYDSEQRITQGIKSKTANSELFNKYQGEKQIQQAQRYQFENDSEDDEMEKELASNLDQISNYSKKLKNTAKVMGQEVDAQNERLRRIEEDADRLDINVHLNSSRLNNIR